MARENGLNGSEPSLGGDSSLTGMEPSFSHHFRPLYGRFRVRGEEAPEVSGRRRPLVVLLEADHDVGDLVTLIADSNGYEIQIAIDNHQALELIRTSVPDLLITNIRGRGVEGISLIYQIRHELDTKIQQIPIIVMDVRRRQHDIHEAFACGADDYLAKPYDIFELLRSWRQAISSLRRPSPLTALDNPDGLVRQTALAVLLEMRPEGSVDGLGYIASHSGDLHVRAAARWALRRFGTTDAQDILASLPATGSLTDG